MNDKQSKIMSEATAATVVLPNVRAFSTIDSILKSFLRLRIKAYENAEVELYGMRRELTKHPGLFYRSTLLLPNNTLQDYINQQLFDSNSDLVLEYGPIHNKANLYVQYVY